MAESPADFLSQAAYARWRGVNRSHITRLKQAGVLVMRGDRVASDAVLDDKPLDPVEPPPSAAGGQQQRTTFASARVALAVYRAKLAKLDFEFQSGLLIEAAGCRLVVDEPRPEFRDRILGIPERVSAVVAAERDPAKISGLVRGEIARCLDDLEESLAKASKRA